ncbi:hypothetical protein AAHE18_03G302000 [Arachis hypogaea]|nr:uncharacterized protein DS421_3g98670 [Arachis hypogaea]
MIINHINNNFLKLNLRQVQQRLHKPAVIAFCACSSPCKSEERSHALLPDIHTSLSICMDVFSNPHHRTSQERNDSFIRRAKSFSAKEPNSSNLSFVITYFLCITNFSFVQASPLSHTITSLSFRQSQHILSVHKRLSLILNMWLLSFEVGVSSKLLHECIMELPLLSPSPSPSD